MRDYSKAEPKMWHGATMKALRRRGPEGVIVALYLMTSPSSNMLGLFSQPVLYMAHETGLGFEGASKGLRDCIEVGFCSYDEDSEMVWVHEMARYQIAQSLKATDLRCKGVQREYEGLPDNPFLGPFFDRYGEAFHLTERRCQDAEIRGASEAPSKGLTKPLRSQEQEQEQEQEKKPPIPPEGGKRPGPVGLKAWLEAIKAKGEKPIPEADSVFAYAAEVGIPDDMLALAWREFRHRYSQPDAKRYRDWRSVFRKAVRGNWLKLWYLDSQGQYQLTTVGHQAQRAADDRRAA